LFGEELIEGEQLKRSVALPIKKTDSKDFIERTLLMADNSNAKGEIQIRVSGLMFRVPCSELERFNT
jgi:hypothetical protein